MFRVSIKRSNFKARDIKDAGILCEVNKASYRIKLMILNELSNFN
jgi:hypothetical protein